MFASMTLEEEGNLYSAISTTTAVHRKKVEREKLYGKSLEEERREK